MSQSRPLRRALAGAWKPEKKVSLLMKARNALQSLLGPTNLEKRKKAERKRRKKARANRPSKGWSKKR